MTEWISFLKLFITIFTVRRQRLIDKMSFSEKWNSSSLNITTVIKRMSLKREKKSKERRASTFYVEV